MTNINDLLNAAKGWADLAGKKANEAVEVSKLQINNVKINGDLQKAYEKLGAFVYKMHIFSEKYPIFIIHFSQESKVFADSTDKP